MRVLVAEQVVRTFRFLNCSGFQNNNFVVIHDGVQPVGDGDDGAVGELLSNGLLKRKSFDLLNIFTSVTCQTF